MPKVKFNLTNTHYAVITEGRKAQSRLETLYVYPVL